MCFLDGLYNEKVSFWGYILTIQNAFPTVKAFHSMNLNQNKCLNSNTASNMTAKVAKPIKNVRKQGRLCTIEFHFFGMPIKTLGSLGKIREGRVTGNTHIFFFGLSIKHSPQTFGSVFWFPSLAASSFGTSGSCV